MHCRHSLIAMLPLVRSSPWVAERMKHLLPEVSLELHVETVAGHFKPLGLLIVVLVCDQHKIRTR